MEFDKLKYEGSFNFRLKNTIVSYPKIYIISKVYHPPLPLKRRRSIFTCALPSPKCIKFMRHGMRNITNCWLISIYRLRVYSKKRRQCDKYKRE